MTMAMKTYGCVFALLLLALLVNGDEASGSQGGKHVMCYFDGSAALLEHPNARFVPEDLDLTICTHLVYERAEINRDLDVVPRDRTLDLQEDQGIGLYHRTVALKERKPGLEVYLDVFDGKFAALGKSMLAGNNSAVVTIAKNAAKFVKTHGFDGMNLKIFPDHEEHPGGQGFGRFLPVIREELQQHGIKLMVSLAPIDHPDEVPFEMTESLSSHLDLIVVASYWNISKEKTTIMSSPRELERIVDGFTNAGIPSEKLVVAIPAFSIAMKLCDRENPDVGRPICGEGDEGTFTESKAVLYSSELMKKMANTSEGWSLTKDPKSQMLFGDSNSLLWTSYEDYTSIRKKAEIVLEKNLGGVAIIKSNMEDFKGEFTGDGETFPITRNAYKRLYEE